MSITVANLQDNLAVFQNVITLLRFSFDSALYLQGVRCWGMDWIELAQDRNRWQALVNVLMNL